MAINSNNKNQRQMAEINVTPLVDVMLVLLVIFMVTAPMMFGGINLQLPKTKKLDNVHLNQEQIILSLTSSQEFYLNQDKVLLPEIIPLIKEKLKSGSDQTIFIRADHSLAYGKVANLMAHLKSAGVLNLALVTENSEK